MNRREMIKYSGTSIGAVAVLGPAALLQTGCGDTKQLSRWTSTMIQSLRDVSPILTDMGANSVVVLIGRALPIAEKLKKAFDDNNNVDAFAFLDNLINPQTGIIVEIANSIGALADDGRKRLVLGLLAIGMVALRLISAQIEQTIPEADAAIATAARPSAARAVKRAAQADPLAAAFKAVKF